MIISKEIPAILKRLEEAFGIDWEDGYCIVWGDTCHSKYDVPPDIYAHEEVHCEQQRLLGPEIWWESYINDTDFRTQQELEAYKVQIKFIKDHPEMHSRSVRRFAIDYICKKFSSETYGNIISYKKAKELLK